jgi:hypothetical protein
LVEQLGSVESGRRITFFVRHARSVVRPDRLRPSSGAGPAGPCTGERIELWPPRGAAHSGDVLAEHRRVDRPEAVHGIGGRWRAESWTGRYRPVRMQSTRRRHQLERDPDRRRREKCGRAEGLVGGWGPAASGPAGRHARSPTSWIGPPRPCACSSAWSAGPAPWSSAPRPHHASRTDAPPPPWPPGPAGR